MLFRSALQKGLRALESGRVGWVVSDRPADDRVADDSPDAVRAAMSTPTPERIFQIKRALLAGMTVAEIHALTMVDPWFLNQMRELVDAEREFAALSKVDAESMRAMKRMGFLRWGRCPEVPEMRHLPSRRSPPD